MNDETPLFRSAALEAGRTSTAGAILLTRPVSFALATLAAAIAGGAIVAFFIWGTYTRHTTLSGQLSPDAGVIGVHPQQHGTIVEKHVSEGDAVATGDVLFVVSSERRSSALGETRKLIAIELEKKLASLDRQLGKLGALERTERESLEQTAAALSSERTHLRGMMAGQAARVALAEQAAARYERLHADGYVSEEMLIAKREALLEQRSSSRQLEREASRVTARLVDVRSQLASLPPRYANRRAELERAIAGTRQELTENEAARRITLTAPASGIATAVHGELGRFVDGGTPLVSLVPERAALHAKLFAPSRAIGFVNIGDSVRVRYEAYPYERFGHHDGRVAAISRAPVPASAHGTRPARGSAPHQPVYEVTVELGSQTVHAYGQERPLRAGMTVEADVLHETRHLYEWMLEPLYTLTGTMH